jgi:hypothetical protein
MSINDIDDAKLAVLQIKSLANFGSDARVLDVLDLLLHVANGQDQRIRTLEKAEKKKVKD